MAFAVDPDALGSGEHPRGVPELAEGPYELAFGIEYLDPAVHGVYYVEVALGVNGYMGREVELALLLAPLADSAYVLQCLGIEDLYVMRVRVRDVYLLALEVGGDPARLFEGLVRDEVADDLAGRVEDRNRVGLGVRDIYSAVCVRRNTYGLVEELRAHRREARAGHVYGVEDVDVRVRGVGHVYLALYVGMDAHRLFKGAAALAAEEDVHSRRALLEVSSAAKVPDIFYPGLVRGLGPEEVRERRRGATVYQNGKGDCEENLQDLLHVGIVPCCVFLFMRRPGASKAII